MLKYLLSLACLSLICPMVLACELTIYGSNNKYPKVYLEDGEAKGVLVDMVHYIGEQIQCDMTIKLSPWKRAYKHMLAGHGGIIGLSKTSEREQVLWYSKAMFTDRIFLISHKDQNIHFSRIEDLQGKTLAHSRGSSYGDDFNRALENKIIISQPDNGNLAARLMMILHQRVDVGIFGPGMSAVIKLINENPKLHARRHELMFHEKPFKKDLNYLGFAKGKFPEALTQGIDQAIEKGIQSGAFHKIESSYFYHIKQ